jgi:hypothetical protein
VKQFLTVAGEGQIEAGGEDAFKRAAHEGVAFADDQAGRVHGVLCFWLGARKQRYRLCGGFSVSPTA